MTRDITIVITVVNSAERHYNWHQVDVSMSKCACGLCSIVGKRFCSLIACDARGEIKHIYFQIVVITATAVISEQDVIYFGFVFWCR